MTTIANIITRFELYMDDTSDLSSSEELELAQRVSDLICSNNSWEVLKREASGTLSTTLAYVDLPSDFSHVIQNANYTENSMTNDGDMSAKVVFVGDTNRPYKVINWSNRRQYEDQDGYCYIDIVNSRLYFTKQPTSADSYEFDYMSAPPTLTTAGGWIFPDKFISILFYGMCVDSYIIQQFDKARSYAPENQAKYEAILENMQIWNSNLINY